MAEITRTKRRTRHATVVSVERLTPGHGPRRRRRRRPRRASAPASSPTTTSSSSCRRRARPTRRRSTPRTSRRSCPREQWPRTRTYTVRAWDAERRLLTIDFVVHGDTGVAGPWAAAAQPGDVLQLIGPGRRVHARPRRRLAPDGRRPSVLPAIAASLAARPGGRARPRARRGRREADRQALPSPGRPARHLAARRRPRRGCSTRVRALAFPDGAGPRVRPRRGERPSAPCAATCSSTAASRARRCRSPATGSARAPKRAGARTRRSGTAWPSRTWPDASAAVAARDAYAAARGQDEHPQASIDWASAEVRGGDLTVALAGERERRMGRSGCRRSSSASTVRAAAGARRR